MNCAGLILAAGGSSRLGHPKQLVTIEGETLIERIVAQLLAIECSHLYVVLGAYRELIEPLLDDHPVEIVFNPDWKAGQSTSLNAGLSHARQRHQGSLLIALCDQPFIPTQHYRHLRETVEDKVRMHNIAATDYAGVPGVPVCLASDAWRKLSDQTGDVGAKVWLRQQPADQVACLPCPQAVDDIDR